MASRRICLIALICLLMVLVTAVATNGARMVSLQHTQKALGIESATAFFPTLDMLMSAFQLKDGERR